MTTSTIRLLVVAPGRVHRDGLAQVLARRPRLDVVATAATADDALALVGEHAPDAVLVDVAAGGLPAIRPLAGAAKVVALGPGGDEALFVACAEAGVAGYADVDGSLDELERILGGEAACPPELAGALLRELARGTPHLTPREREILALVDEGLSNKEIAARLQIRVPTVKNHVHNVLEKLGVNGRSAAAARVRGVSPPAP